LVEHGTDRIEKLRVDRVFRIALFDADDHLRDGADRELRSEL